MTETHLKPSDSQASVALPRVAGYTLLHTIYESSVCTLYKARQERLGRIVALKLLPELPPPCDVALERFNRAAYVMAQVVHPNIPVLYETGTADGHHFAALEFVSGTTLQDILSERGRLSERRAVWVALQVARALAALHAKAIVHRNIKPKNFLVEPDGRVRLIGFGLAKCDAACFSKNLDEQTIGTPHYMAPEMIRGRLTDPRSDLYSLGVSLYVMVTGRPPFPKGIPAAVMAKHLYEHPRPLQQIVPELSDEFLAFTDELLAKNPDDRVSSAHEAVRRLERLAARHDYSDLCFAGAPRTQRDPKPARVAMAVYWQPLAVFFGSLLAVFLGGLALIAAYFALIGETEKPAHRPPRHAPILAPAENTAAPYPAGQARIEPDRPGSHGMVAEDRLAAQGQEAAKHHAEYKRLRELDPVFRRDCWRGIREWESFLRVHPEAPAAQREEAEPRIRLFRQMALDRIGDADAIPQADPNGEALEF